MKNSKGKHHGYTFWSRHSILARIIVSTVAVLLVVLIGNAYLRLARLAEYHAVEASQRPRDLIGFISPLIAEQVIIGDYAAIKQLLDYNVSHQTYIHSAKWQDPDGNVILAEKQEKVDHAPAWISKLFGISVTEVSDNVVLGGTDYGKLTVNSSINPALSAIWSEFKSDTIAVFVLFCLISLSFAVVLRPSIYGLRNLSDAAKRFAQGDYSSRTPVSGSSEVVSAAFSFNSMAEQLEQYVLSLAEKEEQLQEQLHFTTQLLEALPNPVFFLDGEGRFQQVNRAWEELFNIPKEAVIDKRLHDITIDIPAAGVLWKESVDIFNGIAKKTRSYEVEVDDEQKQHLLFRNATIHHQDGSPFGMIGTITNLTELKRAEAKAQQALMEKAIAEESNKAKSVFITNISHELRTPLNSIITLSEMMMRPFPHEKLHTYLSTIHDSGTHLLDVINNIISTSQIESGAMVLTTGLLDIHQMLISVRAITDPQVLKKRIEFKMEIDADVPGYVLADEVRIRQILVNLLGNAIKFTREGSVTLRVKNMTVKQEDHVTLRFEIEDTGCGIPRERQSDIFKPFSQIDDSSIRQYDGSGLGLSISRQLIKLMGGDIGVKSTLDVGSLFWFEITLQRAHEDVIERQQNKRVVGAVEDPTHPKPQKPLDILLAEDNPTSQLVLNELLSQFGHRVTIVSDGDATLETLCQRHFDLLILDYQMPKKSGLDVLRAMEKTQNIPKVPVLALTADASAATIRQLKRYTPAVHTKPILVEQLMDAIQCLIRDTNTPANMKSS